MILIITHRTDETTVEICCWLLSLQKKFKILELSDVLEIEKISPDHISFKNMTRDYSLNLYEISTVFYRQGNIGSFQNLSLKSSDKYSKFFCQKESKIILEFIYRRISNIKHFGHPENANENKLNTLYLAKELGLQVPEYIYTGSKKELLNFFEANALIVTKDNYSINVSLLNGLTTSYSKTLIYKEQMKGKAEIITRNVSVMDRIFFNFRKLIVNINS